MLVHSELSLGEPKDAALIEKDNNIFSLRKAGNPKDARSKPRNYATGLLQCDLAAAGSFPLFSNR